MPHHFDDSSKQARRLRQMNEFVRQRRDEFDGGAAAAHTIMCECADPDCAEMLRITAMELDSVRVDPDLFFVDRAHIGDALVIELTPRHAVVRIPTV